MEGFDVEAYMEEQVAQVNKDSKEKAAAEEAAAAAANTSSSSKGDDQKDGDRDRRRRSRSRDRDGRSGGGRNDDRRDLREDTRGGDRDRDGRGGGDYAGPRGRGGDSRAGMGRRGDSRDRYGDLRGPPPRGGGGGGYDRDSGRYGPGPSGDRYRDSGRDRDRGTGVGSKRDRSRSRDRSRDRKDKEKGGKDEKSSSSSGTGNGGKTNDDPESRGGHEDTHPSSRNKDPNEGKPDKVAVTDFVEKIVDKVADREAARRKREIDDLTKDQRTMFVSQLTAKITETHLERFFGELGRVNNVIMIRDKATGRHKGFAYVEMADVDTVPDCLLFNNVVPDFQKFPILVKASEAEKNFNAKKETVIKTVDKKGSGNKEIDTRLYVGNIHVHVNEAQLKAVLEQFGPVEMITLHRDELGNSKGFAFIRYANLDHAEVCLSKMNGAELMGRTIKPLRADGTASSAWSLDADAPGGGHVHMTSSDRMMLMAKLGQSHGITVPLPSYVTNPVPPPLPAGPAPGTSMTVPALTGIPSRCFMIRNMFDPAEETEENWDQEIREDVMEECGKYGTVVHCHVENRKPGGLVFLKFAALEPAVQAAISLNGRFFAGKMVTATFLDPALYGMLASGSGAVPGDVNEGLPAVGTTQALAGSPSECFMIRNMFDPAEETEENWDQEIREDVMEECGKYGTVVHCHVEKTRPGGLVFMHFGTVDASLRAATSLNGRQFAGRMITITFLDVSLYTAATQS